MKKILFVLALLLAVATSSYAQTHPCDITPGTTFREPSAQLVNLRVGFCHDQKDAEGNLITEALGFTIQIEGGQTVDLGVMTPANPVPNANGDFYYETAPGVLTSGGTVRATAYASGLGSSVPSQSVLLTLLGPPKAPKKLDIKR